MGTTSRTRNGALTAITTACTAMAVMLLATACHSRNTSQSGSPSTAPSGTDVTGAMSAPAASSSSSPHPASSAYAQSLATCDTATLTMSIDVSQGGGAAGSTFLPVDFTNTSGTACTLAGYPGVSFVTAPGAAGRQIGAAAQRNPAFGRTVVRLAPGGDAHAWLQVAQAGNYPESSCHPVTALGLRVYPPGETNPGFVGRNFPACADASAALLTVMPVRPGKGVQGTTP